MMIDFTVIVFYKLMSTVKSYQMARFPVFVGSFFCNICLYIQRDIILPTAEGGQNREAV
jgi:hypothetical protein